MEYSQRISGGVNGTQQGKPPHSIPGNGPYMISKLAHVQGDKGLVLRWKNCRSGSPGKRQETPLTYPSRQN
jgi:hypothetical protein